MGLSGQVSYVKGLYGALAKWPLGFSPKTASYSDYAVIAGGGKSTDPEASTVDGANFMDFYLKTTGSGTSDVAGLKIQLDAQSAGSGYAIKATGKTSSGVAHAEIGGIYAQAQASGGTITGQQYAGFFEYIVDAAVANAPSGGCIQLAAICDGALNEVSGFISLRDYGTNKLKNLFNIAPEIASGTGKMWYGSTLRIRINSGAKYLVLSDAENALTLNETVTYGINMSSGVKTNAIYIAAGACTAGLVFGAKSSDSAVGHHIGVANSADTAGDKAIAVFADDANAVLASDAQGINSRCLILHAQTGPYAMDSLRGHLRIVASVTPSEQKGFAATSGYVEASGTYTLGNATNVVFISGLSGTVELGGTPTVSANVRLCGALLSGNFTAAYNGDTKPAVGVMFQGQTYGFQFALGFHDGVSGMVTTATDSTQVTHKIAVWINGVGTRYLRAFSD